MATTFSSLCKLADFDSAPQSVSNPAADDEEDDEIIDQLSDTSGSEQSPTPALPKGNRRLPKLAVSGLHYNIQIILPESRDPAVYDALFRSLREHLG